MTVVEDMVVDEIVVDVIVLKVMVLVGGAVAVSVGALVGVKVVLVYVLVAIGAGTTTLAELGEGRTLVVPVLVEGGGVVMEVHVSDVQVNVVAVMLVILVDVATLAASTGAAAAVTTGATVASFFVLLGPLRFFDTLVPVLSLGSVVEVGASTGFNFQRLSLETVALGASTGFNFQRLSLVGASTVALGACTGFNFQRLIPCAAVATPAPATAGGAVCSTCEEFEACMPAKVPPKAIGGQ